MNWLINLAGQSYRANAAGRMVSVGGYRSGWVAVDTPLGGDFCRALLVGLLAGHADQLGWLCLTCGA
ncbi:MAG: hypothetical protein CBB71_00320 [Rhodopirellula sp. TMED11]|nr:MAG: hypothetical protein CBB71_00320 [Rhodopirellula sp. TMED11]